MNGRLLPRRLARLFTRAAKPTRTTFREKLDSKIKVTPDTDKRLLDEETRLRPDDPDISDKSLAMMHLRPQILPEK